MKIKTTLRPILQYTCLYLLLLCHDVAIYREHTLLIRMAIAVFCVIVIAASGKVEKGLLIFAGLLSTYLLVKTEFKLLLNYLECILITYTSINIDRKKFCERFIKIVSFFTVLSLVFYILGVLNPDLLLKIFNKENHIEWSFYGKPYYLRGRWLYCVKQYELERNNSVFTEPGLFQMLICSCLFMLLFMRSSLKNLSDKKVNFLIALFIIAVITTGSTTGYMAFIMIIGIYIISNKNMRRTERNNKKYIRKVLKYVLTGGAGATAVIMINYILLRDQSFIYRFLIQKIVEMFSDGTSGHARTSMISICLPYAVKNLFGVGEDYLSLALRTQDMGANGGILVHTFASIGLIPSLLILFYYYKDVFVGYVPKWSTVLIIGLYVNTSLAQSRFLYPALLVLPVVYGQYCKNMYLKKVQKYDE